jgi:hypothetical protein
MGAAVMTFRSKVVGDVIVLPPGVSLPEGMEVTVEVPNQSAPTGSGTSEPSIRNGVPIFPSVVGAPQSDLALINNLSDNESTTPPNVEPRNAPPNR